MSRTQTAYDAARDEAARQASDAVRKYDSRVRKLVQDAPIPVDEAVGRYPWASLSAMLLVGVAIGFVTGTGLAVVVNALMPSSHSRADRAPDETSETAGDLPL